MKEIWKDYKGNIKELYGLLKVSNLGRVYKIGINTSKGHNRILKGTKSSNGYIRLHLSINGKDYNLPLHRIVAETFCPNPDSKPYVDHINAIREDNRACNLQWVTHKENCHNPIYLSKLSSRKSKELLENNWLSESNKKKVILEDRQGKVKEFDSIKAVNEYFHTKANLNRLLHKGTFVTSKRSKLYGYRLSLKH